MTRVPDDVPMPLEPDERAEVEAAERDAYEAPPMPASTHCDGCGRRLGTPVPLGQVAYCQGCWAKDDRDAAGERGWLERNHGPTLPADLRNSGEPDWSEPCTD